MLLGDLIYNDFDVNCNYAVYNCIGNKSWHEVEPAWSTRINGYHKPPCTLLDKKIKYITLNSETKELIIEVN